MSDLKVTGKLLEKNDTQNVNDRFKKREFVLELSEEINGNVYTNFAKFQLVQSKCDILDRYKVGDEITVNFNIKGNRWERDGKVNYITNLDAWRIEGAQQQGNQPAQQGQNQSSYNAQNNGSSSGYPQQQNNSKNNSGEDQMPF